MAVTHGCHSFYLNKEFRKNIDIKQHIKKGSKAKKIFLPPEEFVYGKRNRTPTPVKNVIYYEYARQGEDTIKKTYDRFMQTSQTKIKLQPIITKKFEEKMKKSLYDRYVVPVEKPMYKMKIFQGVESKVKQKLINNRQKLSDRLTNSMINNNDYEGNNYKSKNHINQPQEKDNIDFLIEKVEDDIKNL